MYVDNTQSLYIDINTQIIKMLLIQGLFEKANQHTLLYETPVRFRLHSVFVLLGGRVVIDDTDVILRAENILITSGGSFEVNITILHSIKISLYYKKFI